MITDAEPVVQPELDPETVGQVRGSTVLLVGRISGLFVNAATQVIVVRYLTKGDFGSFAFALSLAAAGTRLVSIGHGQVSGRFLALYLQRGDRPRMLGTLVLAAATVFGLTAAITLLAAALRGSLGVLLPDGQKVLTLVVVLFLLAATDALDDLLEGAFAVLGRPWSIFLRKYVLTPVALLVVTGFVALTDRGVVALAVGYASVGVLGVAVYVRLLTKALRVSGVAPRLRGAHVVLPVRELFSLGLPLASTDVLSVVMGGVGVVALGAVAGTEGVAVLRAVVPIALLNQLVIYTFTTLFVPLVTRRYEQGDLEGVRRLYWRTAGWLAVMSFPIFALTGPFASAITLGLFGPRYADSVLPLAVLSTGYYLNVLFGFNAATLMAFGRGRELLLVNAACILTNIALYALLVPRWSAAGVAIACAATLVLQNGLNQWVMRSTIGTSYLDREHQKVIASVVIATGAVWLLSVVVSPGLLPALGLSAGGGLLLLLINQRRLQLHETFPELRRLRHGKTDA